MNRAFVDVWTVDLAAGDLDLIMASALLSVDELDRLATLQNPFLRRRYLAVRVRVRQILSQYLQLDPAELVFVRGEFGKPALDNQSVFFNVSHTENCLVLAVASFEAVGVDVERISLRRNLHGLAKRCLSAVEFEFWLGQPEALQTELFYQFWVGKEAFVKAVGRGIVAGLEDCQLNLPELDGFAAIPHDYGVAEDWQLRRLKCWEGLVASLVTPALDYQLAYKVWGLKS